MDDEELELEEEEETEEPKEKKSKGKTEKLELDFSMNAVDRLRQEIDFTDSEYQKVVGEFLLKEFAKDEQLRLAYFTRKVTLKAIWDSIVAAAKKKAVGGSAVMSDEEVFGLAIHFIQDGKVKEERSQKYVLTKDVKKSLEEQAKEEYLAEQKAKLAEEDRKRKEREEKAKKKALEKEKKELEDSGQMTLFDLFGDEDEDTSESDGGSER